MNEYVELNAVVEIDSSRMDINSEDIENLKSDINEIRTALAKHREQLLKSSLVASLYTGVPGWLNDCVDSSDNTYEPKWLMEGYTSPMDKYAATPPATSYGKVLSDGSISHSTSTVCSNVFSGEMTVVLNSGYYVSGVLKQDKDGQNVAYYEYIDCCKCSRYREGPGVCSEYGNCTKRWSNVYYAVAGYNYQLNIVRKDEQDIPGDEYGNVIIRAYNKI